MGDVIPFKRERFIVKIYVSGGDLVAMRETRKMAEELLDEEGYTEGDCCEIYPIEPGQAWYNGIC